ncbi:TP53I11 [Bugula neritina]|uniref:Tumor protein p53-inducible protein 11 n=1 Tax=Bugula neritina TaxID=10212 RepID=A0A7J7J1M6_BUGNE|nr:TP53I11 [Bugula neritina]
MAEQGASVKLPTILDKRETLQKRQSNSNLQSRLKSRKILGVGVTGDGLDVHRSKVSQILGHNEKILSNFKPPFRGIQWWNFCLSMVVMFSALWSLFLPQMYSNLMFGDSLTISIMYSVCLFCVSLPLMASSHAVEDKYTQMYTTTTAEVLLISHLAASFYGGANQVTFFQLLLLLTNSWHLGKTFLSLTSINLMDTISYSQTNISSTLLPIRR